MDTLKIRNAIEFTKDVFWKFYFFPMICSLFGIIIIVVFKIEYEYAYAIDMIAPFCVWQFLIFWRYGKRTKNFHAGDE